jgi:hypothetical protein
VRHSGFARFDGRPLPIELGDIGMLHLSGPPLRRNHVRDQIGYREACLSSARFKDGCRFAIHFNGTLGRCHDAPSR